MNTPILLFWEYLFKIFGILSLQCSALSEYFAFKDVYGQKGLPLWGRGFRSEYLLIKHISCVLSVAFFHYRTEKIKTKREPLVHPLHRASPVGNGNRYPLHCRRTLYAKSYSNGATNCYSEPYLVLLQHTIYYNRYLWLVKIVTTFIKKSFQQLHITFYRRIKIRHVGAMREKKNNFAL